MDGRNWLHHKPVYEPYTLVAFLYPDEWDVIEDPRAALAYAKAAVGPWESFQEWQYRP